MFFDHYPYTNFHNVNLDWVLQAVKAWGQTVEANDRAFRDLQEANEDFKAYVTNYLQDLDVSDEINAKLDAMLAAGTLTPYFAPYVKGYVESWLANNVTPTTPALDKTLSLEDAAANAAATGERIERAAYLRTLDGPKLSNLLNKNLIIPEYRIQSACNVGGYFYVCGGSEAADGRGFIAKMSSLDFKDAEITYYTDLGHANDITYSYTTNHFYVTTVGEGVAWGIWDINPNDLADKTLITNCPENSIGIQYVDGWMYVLAPPRIYRTLDFETYTLVINNTNEILNRFSIQSANRISQTLVRLPNNVVGWVGSYIKDPEHIWYGFIAYFGSHGPITFDVFPTYGAECQAAIWDGKSTVHVISNGTTSPAYTVMRMDSGDLKYLELGAGKDLNDYTGEGLFYLIGAATMDNCPVRNEGLTLKVSRQGLANTRQDIYTNSGRHLYRIKLFNPGTWSEWSETAAEISEIKEDLIALSTSPSLTWSIGKNIGASGTVQSNTSAALSNVISVSEGTRIKRVGASKDSNNKDLFMYVNAYENMVFKSRTILNKDDTYTVPSDVNAICFGFARAGSYGIAMSAEDIDNYYGAEWHFATESSVNAEKIPNSGEYLDNLLEKFCVFASGSNNGVSYDLIDSDTHAYYVHGSTADSFSFYNLYNGLLPDCLERGKTYIIYYDNSAESPKCYARFIFYDKDGGYAQPTVYGSPYSVTIPDNAFSVIFRLYVAARQTVDTTIKYLKLAEVQRQKMLVPYIISFVDDDASATTYVERYYNSCKRNGINGNYAVITNKFESGATDPDLLLNCEDDGMGMLIHCSEQSYSVAPEWMDRDYDKCRKNLYKGMRAMQEKGFVNYRYWVTPYGYVNDDFKRLAVDAGMKCMISSANFTYNNMAHADRYFIKRYSLDPVDTDGSKGNLAAIKTAIDDMQNLPSCWMIITTHFNSWDSVTWDSTVDETGYPVGYERMNEVIQYAKASGAAVLTVPEAWRFYEPILEANEQRYNKIRP